MRFCLVTVVRGQKHVVIVYDDHSDEMSRKVAQAEEGRVQFEDVQASPWSVPRSAFHHPRGNREIRKHLSQSRFRLLSRFQASHMTAAQRKTGLQLLEVYLAEMHGKHPLRLRHKKPVEGIR